MGGILLNLYIAKQTLINTQLGLQVTSNNISHADDENYARQKVVIKTNPYYRINAGWAPTGARAVDIVQERDRFLERRLLNAVSGKNDYETRESYLGRAERLVAGDDNYGIRHALGEFWNAWDRLQQNPQGRAERSLIYEAALKTADTIRTVQDDLISLQNEIRDAVSTTVDERINPLLKQISEYNKKIIEMEASGRSANNIRDLRYAALSELAKEISFKVSEDSDGAVTISCDSHTLVNRLDYVVLSYDETSDTVSYQDATGTGGALGSGTISNPGGGRLQGYLESLKKIASYLDKVDALAAAIKNEVNGAHVDDSGSEVPVFALDTAGRLLLDPNFQNDYQTLIQSSQAITISSLQNKLIADLGNTTFAEYVATLQEEIGYEVGWSGSQASFQEVLRTELKQRQQDVSGVSIDEEVLKAMEYQHIYEAAGRLVKATKEMLDTLINMVD